MKNRKYEAYNGDDSGKSKGHSVAVHDQTPKQTLSLRKIRRHPGITAHRPESQYAVLSLVSHVSNSPNTFIDT